MRSALIELGHIVFAYPRTVPILNDVTLSLGAGEKIALTGANGTGKSTLLQLIVGLHLPFGGALRVFDQTCRGESDFADVRRRVGLLFQDPDDQLFCPTVIEDVVFGPLNLGKSRSDALRIAARVLHDLDLDGFGERITYRLSSGEKRLVALATVLAMNPDVLLLDEPTNGLDETNTQRIGRIVAALPQSMIIVAHDAAFLDAIVTRRVRLRAGRVEEY